MIAKKLLTWQALLSATIVLGLGAFGIWKALSKPQVLQVAARQGNLPVVRAALAAGANPNTRESHGTTIVGTPSRDDAPLNVAVKSGSLETVSLLLDRGARIDGVGFDGTAIGLAIQLRQLEMVRLLHRRGANMTNDGMHRTLLERAILNQDYEIAEYILNADIPVDCRISPSGYTPLCRATERGDVQGTKFLLDHGADPNIQCMLPIGYTFKDPKLTPLQDVRKKIDRLEAEQKRMAALDQSRPGLAGAIRHGKSELTKFRAVEQLLTDAIAQRNNKPVR